MINWQLLTAFRPSLNEWIFTPTTGANWIKLVHTGTSLDMTLPIGLIADGISINPENIEISQHQEIFYSSIPQVLYVNFTPIFGQNERRIAIRQLGKFSNKSPWFLQIYTS